MVKLYASILSLTLATSLALAYAPYPSHTHGLEYYDRDLLDRDLDEEFSGREYLLNASDDLKTREPNFFSGIEKAAKDVGKVAVNGLHVAEKIAENPYVQAATSVLPGGAGLVVAEKVVGAIGKFEDLAQKAKQAGHKVQQLKHMGGSTALRKGKNAIKKAKQADRKVEKRLGGAIGKVKKAVRGAKQIASAHHTTAQRRHHRRDLENDEELSRRDFDAEELFAREYDDFLAERDFFDDLD